MFNERADAVHSQVEALCIQGQYEALDELLQRLRLAELSGDELMAYLAATAPVADRLPRRRAFFDRVRRVLDGRGHLRGGMLTGLDGVHVGKSAPPVLPLGQVPSVARRDVGSAKPAHSVL